MVALKLGIVLFFNIIYVSECIRRIKDGKPVTAEKRYVVYLVKAPNSDKIYDYWLCGGALVSSLFIVTSAACVDDVEYLYAIAGYKKYITDDKLDKDACTKAKKKKVIYTCVPMKYELNYHQVEKWSFIDIALVKVESAYDFSDESYKKVCSYIPTVIPINYEPKFQSPGIDAVVYGWGHEEIWRQTGDHSNYNQELMRYASTKVIDKPTCKKHYEIYPNMSEVIDQFMICTLSQGELNDNGDLILLGPEPPKLDGCKPNQAVKPLNAVFCDEDGDYHDLLVDDTRREDYDFDDSLNETSYDNINITRLDQTNDQSRKHGICQNDHGGPLVTWVGGNEVLIGVASVFKVSDDFKCMGPYLFTSTQCNGAFLDCILTSASSPAENKIRRAICDLPPIQRGYDTVERFISWKNHPAGPADNERHVGFPLKKSKSLERLVKLAVATLAQNHSVAVRPQRPLRPINIPNNK